MFYDVSLLEINGGIKQGNRTLPIKPLTFALEKFRGLRCACSNRQIHQKVIDILQAQQKLNIPYSSYSEIAKSIDEWIVSESFFDHNLLSKEELFSIGATSKMQEPYIRFFRKNRYDPDWSDPMNPLRRQYPDFSVACFHSKRVSSPLKIQKAISDGRLYEALLLLKEAFEQGMGEQYLYLFNPFLDAWVAHPPRFYPYIATLDSLNALLKGWPEILIYALTGPKEERIRRFKFFGDFNLALHEVKINDRGITLLEYAFNICDEDLLIALVEAGGKVKKIKWQLLDEAAFCETLRRVEYFKNDFDRFDALNGCEISQNSWQWRYAVENGLIKALLGTIDRIDLTQCEYGVYLGFLNDLLVSWKRFGTDYNDPEVRMRIDRLRIDTKAGRNAAKRSFEGDASSSKRHKKTFKSRKRSGFGDTSSKRQRHAE